MRPFREAASIDLHVDCDWLTLMNDSRTYLPYPDDLAILFDFDGTLVDTMPVHRKVWDVLFAPYGFQITDQWWADCGNLPLHPYVTSAIPNASAELAGELNLQAIELFNDHLHVIEPIEHVVTIAQQFHGKLPLAVVTGSYRDVVIPVLDAIGITGLFDLVVTADDVQHSKPAPDLYQLAMHRMSVAAGRCLVYEDSEIGVESARLAGVGRIVDIRTWPVD